MHEFGETLRRLRTRHDHRIRSLPILVLAPHSRCNCRCVMCDIWRANSNRRELSRDDLMPHVEALRRLQVRQIAFTGGEALMHSNLWLLLDLLRPLEASLSLLSTGLLLRSHRQEIVDRFDEVIVSLDGPPEVHDEIRNIPRAFERLADGVAALRELAPSFRITARSVIQRRNHHLLRETAQTARDLGADQISFLAADLTSEAFEREGGWGADRQEDVAVEVGEVEALRRSVQDLLTDASLNQGDFVAETPEQFARAVHHFEAFHGSIAPVAPPCNAPWVSTVIEADGSVLPCFFHPAIGHLEDGPLDQILNSKKALRFRRSLNVAEDPICQRCTCSLFLSARADVDRRT